MGISFAAVSVFTEGPMPVLGKGDLQLFLAIHDHGPCQATGSPIGRPEMRRKRTARAWVVMVTSSPSPWRMVSSSPHAQLPTMSKQLPPPRHLSDKGVPIRVEAALPV